MEIPQPPTLNPTPKPYRTPRGILAKEALNEAKSPRLRVPSCSLLPLFVLVLIEVALERRSPGFGLGFRA